MQEMQDQIVKLTNAVYRIIEFFPESDPLKNRAKDRALSVMEKSSKLEGINGWVSFQTDKIESEILEDIDILLKYLWIAKSQGWLSFTNYLIFEKEYGDLRLKIKPQKEFTRRIPFIGKEIISQPEISVLPEKDKSLLLIPEEKKYISEIKEKKIKKPFELSERQKKIVEFLNENKTAQVMDLQKILEGITKRTIRRDLDELLNMGKIIRKGEFNKVSYEINTDRVGRT